MVVGAMCAYKAWANRASIVQATGQGPAAPDPAGRVGKERVDIDIGRHWKAYLVGGLCVCAIGLAGTVIQFADTVSSAGKPTTDELIDLMVADPNSTFDREEAECYFAEMEEAGIDITKFGVLSSDEFGQAITEAVVSMSPAEFDRVEACLDDESRSTAGSSLSDAELEELTFQLLVDEGVDQNAAECLVEFLQDRNLLREIVSAGESLTPEFDTALLEADQACV